MAQAARTTSPYVGWTVLIAATTAIILVFLGALPTTTNETETWKTLPEPAALPTPDQSGLAEVGDIQMWYAVFNKGGGSPVLLIHGGLETGDTWGNQVPVLARNHEVIIADSRGHGRSTRSDKPFGYQLMADDYIGLLDYLMIDKVAVVGWSDGGIIGLDIAMRHPERLTKLWAYGANFNIGGLIPRISTRIPSSAKRSHEREKNTGACHRHPISTMGSWKRSARCGTRSRTTPRSSSG